MDGRCFHEVTGFGGSLGRGATWGGCAHRNVDLDADLPCICWGTNAVTAGEKIIEQP